VKLRARWWGEWRDLRFAQKLGLLLIALVSLPIVVVVAYNTYTGREALLASAQSRNHERARGTADIIDAFLADARADVRTASGMAAVIDVCLEQTPAHLQRAQRSLRAIRDEQGFVAVYVTDASGRVLTTTDARVVPGQYETGRSFLSAVAGDTVVEDPEYDHFDKTIVLKVSHAVRSAEEELIGTVTALIPVDAIHRLTANDADYGGAGEFGVLWTGAGLRLSHSHDPAVRFTSWAPLSPETEIATRQRLGPAYAARAPDGYGEVIERGAWLLYDRHSNPHVRVNRNGSDILHGTIVPLREQRWLYGIFVPEAELLASLRPQMLRDWGVAFFTIAAALALSVIGARWVTSPLRRVADAANALARGDMSTRVGLQRQDEFGQVASAFDRMADALAEKERQLQLHASTLERHVEERTARLQLFERASRTLASSLELRRTGANLVSLLVPEQVDFCCVDVRDHHGTVRRTACRHVQPDHDRWINETPSVRPATGPAGTVSSDDRARMALTEVRVYELAAGRQFVGYLTVGMTESSGRAFDETIESVCEELGRRAGLALANALLYQEAEEANRLKDEFLGVVSHELRTPLNAILGWTRLAGLSHEAGVDRQQALAAVDRNARALTRLVDDLLDVPRIMTGKLALELQPLDLVANVQSAVEAIRPAAQAKDISVQLRSDVASATIEADSHRLQQVFGNLLSNAVKFTSRGGRIDVGIAKTTEHYVVTVGDTGVGIRADFLPFVFERFRQADSSTSRTYGGLGIGLSIVRHLVEMHGGRVTAASDGIGRGSTFTVELPVVTAAVLPRASEPMTDAGTLGELRGLRLLVLDDDRDSREVLSALLQSSGASVTEVATVAEALKVLSHSATLYDAILADIGMPGEDGYAFIAGLRAAPDARLRALPVVAVTAYASRGDRTRALAAGFDAHVAKPVSPAALGEALLQSVAARRRAMRTDAHIH
jgi:signal transduction histidine kinase/ActR/RegA family two-component response regulator